MIYTQKIRIPASEKTVEIYVANCVICDNNDIEIEEYEDQYGFISTATCKKCKFEIKENVSDFGIIKSWNKRNDIPTLIDSKSASIIKLKEEIKELKLKQIQRIKNGK